MERSELGARIGVLLGMTLLFSASQAAAAAARPGPSSTAGQVWDGLLEGGAWGKVTLEMRLRMELAEVEPLATARAFTLRTHLGYRSPTWRGLSFFVEGANVFTFDHGAYFDGTGTPNGKSLIADPPNTALNQGYLEYVHPETGSSLIAGRQRILLDDQRFIGNVGWRQNEQTYDAGLVQSAFGVKGLNVLYSYVGHVNRVFADKSDAPASERDFDCRCNVLNAHYALAPWLQATVFTYLLDFTTPAAYGFSSNSYGLRLTGRRSLGGPYFTDYAFSYAYQTDAGRNPVSYGASYVAADGAFGFAPLGKLGAGFELLGSDGGRARFVTPLATLHKFNGWADAFLDNGGPDGLRDLYVYAAPALPFGLGGELVYHRFWSDHGTMHLGDEFDAVLSKPINRHLTVLTKVADFNGTQGSGRADRWRFWLQATLTF